MSIPALIAALLLTAGPRSPDWPALAKRHRAENPRCAACGTLQGVQVHHIVPFNTNPSLELDPANLLTLCKEKCHLKIGHGGSYRHYNPHAREYAALALANPTQFEAIVKVCKQSRLKNKSVLHSCLSGEGND